MATVCVARPGRVEVAPSFFVQRSEDEQEPLHAYMLYEPLVDFFPRSEIRDYLARSAN